MHPHSPGCVEISLDARIIACLMSVERGSLKGDGRHGTRAKGFPWVHFPILTRHLVDNSTYFHSVCKDYCAANACLCIANNRMLFFSCCKPVSAPADRSSSDLEVDTRKLDAGLSRSTKELRILQQAPVPITADGKGKPQHSPRSLFEASAYRIAFHEEKARQELNKPEEDHHGLPQKFLEAYVNALKDGNTAWASNPEVADLFSDDVKMTGQDRKTTEGKPQVIRRLNKGIEMLIQMAGKDAAVPTWEIEGPNLTDKISHEYKCTIRRGAMRVSFRLEFTIIRGKIAEFSNTRT